MTRYLNVCIKEVLQTAHFHKLHDDSLDISDGDLEDGSQLLDKTNYTVRDATNLPTERTTCDGLLASESSSLLRENWFTEKKFPAGIPVSDIKYNHPEIKY